MSMLKLNNKIITLDGSVVTAIDYPVKGDLINMEVITGDGNSTFRILKMNGNIAKCLHQTRSYQAVYNHTSNVGTFTNGHSGQLYAGSSLDTLTNQFWELNGITPTAKAAIVPEIRTQYLYKYYDAPNTPNTPTYTYQYQAGDKYHNADLIDSIVIGERNLFVLDLKDIYDYFGKACITADELKTLNIKSTTRSLLSSATTDLKIWFANTVFTERDIFGVLRHDSEGDLQLAFNIDLSKIPFTKTTEVIS